MSRKTLWTVGHSNRSLDDFIQLLASERIEAIADVRRFPGSRRSPHFGSDALASTLRAAEIEYRHFGELGGRRTKRAKDSANSAWQVEAFNAYADYMASGEFNESFDRLIELASRKRTAIVCAEALPWRCHRRLIADQFVARGWQVLDVIGPSQVKEHLLPEFARVADGQVTYPGGTLF